MIFCPKCGSILLPKENGKKSKLICGCGYSSVEKEDILIKEVMEKGRKIEIIDKKMHTLPKTKEECPKCKNLEAYFWMMQTRAGDEAETRFFECTKCGHRWRDYR